MSLPQGWAEYKDPSTGNSYFHCTASGETTWTRPAAPAGDGFGGAAPMQQAQPQMQPQFQPQAGALPPGWTEYKDQSTGNSYFHNASTGETTWTRPVAAGGFGGFGGAAPMMMGGEAWVQGIVKNWDDEKGFGFIDPVAGGDNVFCHRSALQDGSLLEKGASVQFVVSWNASKNKHQVSKCTGAKQGGAQPGGASSFGASSFGSPAPGPGLGAAQEGQQGSGTVKTWFDDKGFGFVTPSDGSKDCYVHRTFLLDGGSLVVGSTVQYTIQYDPAKNKNNATKVTGAVPGDGKGGGKGGAPMQPGMMGGPPPGDYGQPYGQAQPDFGGNASFSPYSGGPPGMPA